AAREPADGRPLFVLDLGMPPNVEPAAGRLAGVTLVDLTALGRHLAGLDVPGQIPQVRAIVAAEAAAYMDRQDQAAAAPVIAAMHAQIRQLADAELARLHDRLPGLSEQQRAETTATVHRILRKVLHRPTVRAKEFSAGPQGPLYLDALRQLFDLDIHSCKDLPTAPVPGLQVAAYPAREDPRDALVWPGGTTLDALPHGARIGTGSPRRGALLRAAGRRLEIVPIRGNVGTRLRK